MENTGKKTKQVISFMLSLLMLYGTSQPAVVPVSAEERLKAGIAENESIVIDFKNVTADGTNNAFVIVNFGNDYTELTRIAEAGVLINDTKLSYNSAYSSPYYAEKGDCIVTGMTIQFYTSSLNEGENTLTFVNPDGENKSIRLRMTKTEVPPRYWYETTSYEYNIELIDSEPQTEKYTVTWKNSDTILETDSDVLSGTAPRYDGEVPVKESDSEYDYTFAGWSLEENGDLLALLPDVSADVTYYAVFTKTAKAQNGQQLYVRLTGSFEHKIIGQADDIDAVSSATTGSASYFKYNSTAHVEFALADKGTALEDVPESSWNKPDYFKNGDLLKVNGAASKVVIEPECDGIYGEADPLTGDVFLRGVPKQSGSFKVYVYLDTDKGSAVSNSLDFEVFDGSEKLIDRLTYNNCIQTADGKYMFDSKPWYITEFGGENETVTVPKDIKAWYGSHAVLPEVNYSELGRTISLTNGEEPTQTLIIPQGCDLTLVNMRIHSGVKIVVEKGGKLTLRQSTAEGIIEVQNGGIFSMDYNAYGGGEWLQGSSINGQLRMKDGSVLENARITSHANYTANDDENRRNLEPLVTIEGSVTVKGDVYILGEEAPTGEKGQTALKVSGTLTVPEGSVLACYGGGTSFLTADGGEAVELDNGTISGGGSLIAIGGYGMNITGDTSKGSGGSAVSGIGTIAVANAYLEGGASFHNSTEPIKGSIEIADKTNRRLVTGRGETTEKSDFYWFGTGDAEGIIPKTEETLAEIPHNAPANDKAINITAEVRDNAVKLTWNAVDGAEKYGIAGFVNGKWKLLAQGSGTSYVRKNLKAGTNYKIAVVAMFDGKWNMDFSNAVTVSPEVYVYPKVRSQIKGSQFRLSWTAVDTAEGYAVAVYRNGWKLLKAVSADTLTYTSSKLEPGTYYVAVAAKVNGRFDTSNIKERAVKITIS